MTNNEYGDVFNCFGVVACSDDAAVKFLLHRAGVDDGNNAIAKQHGWDGSSKYMWSMMLCLPKAFAIVVKILGMNDDGYLSYLLSRDRFSSEQAHDFQARVAKRLSEGDLRSTFHKVNVSKN